MADSNKAKREVSYVILGNSVAWARPGKGRFHHQAYDTQKIQKEAYREHLLYDHAREELFKGPLHLDIVFYIPFTETTKKRQKIDEGSWHSQRPVLSDLVKFIEDCASDDILFHDDCAVTSISTKKLWGRTARTELTIKEL